MKPRIREVIVVEGRYDKNTVSQVVDATIVETRGFGVFSDGALLSLLRRLAETRGIIVLTDSDGAGQLIRGKIKGALGTVGIKHAYIPDIEGREKRKRVSSKAGLLGVEGMSPDTLIESLRRAGATFEGEENTVSLKREITKADMYELGLAGVPDAAERRRRLQEELRLPALLSSGALLEVVNCLFDREEFILYVRENALFA